MSKEQNCMECQTELCLADNDDNGRENGICKRCVAEQDHDFDAEPNAVFSRFGERTDPQRAWTPPARLFKSSEDRPRRLCVTVDQLEKWASTLEGAENGSGATGGLEAAKEIRAMIGKSDERKKGKKA